MTAWKTQYSEWAGRLDSAVSEVFESMLEQNCTPVEETSAVDHSISAQILFSGAIRGECMLFASRSVAQVTAEALLGTTSDQTESMAEDAIGELCNMIAGGWKSKLGPEQAACAISPPLISTLQGPGNLQRTEDSFRRFYSFEGHVFGVEMIF